MHWKVSVMVHIHGLKISVACNLSSSQYLSMLANDTKLLYIHEKMVEFTHIPWPKEKD
jgi:hypothetical protein